MRLKAIPSVIECPQPGVFQAFSPPSSLSVPSGGGGGGVRWRRHEREYSNVSTTPSVCFVSNPFLSRSPSLSKACSSRGGTIRRTCSANLDDPSFGSSSPAGNRSKNAHHCGKSKKARFTVPDQESFLQSRFDFLEPMMLGIRPEKETISWAAIEHKAKSFDIPMSLRLIKKKLQSEEGLSDCKHLAYCPVKTAFSSMVFTVVELQNHALGMREALCSEDLEIIKSKVQKEMHSSFVWLFQQVFSRTPDLMLQVMVLLANFSAYSASSSNVVAESIAVTGNPPLRSETELGVSIEEIIQMGNFTQSPAEELGSVEEINLWNSILHEAMKIRNEIEAEALDYNIKKQFVSPVSVNLEPDVYDEYLRTDLLYQMNLSREPDNPLLICNYAQFLHLVAHDYDRAEECYKKAVQMLPPDAESLAQYANFLWTIRHDFWGAEERFLQALSINPGNSYYASRYANFLWSTGGEETCFPLNNAHNSGL